MMTFHETREILAIMVAIIIILVAMAFFMIAPSYAPTAGVQSPFPTPQASVGVEKIPTFTHDIFAS